MILKLSFVFMYFLCSSLFILQNDYYLYNKKEYGKIMCLIIISYMIGGIINGF